MCVFFFFFKQKTAYEMRISDWSSDVCSSDLDTVKILRGLKSAFEAHHKVTYTPEALRTAVELSARYINDRKLPDKAIDVIDEVGEIGRASGRERVCQYV